MHISLDVSNLTNTVNLGGIDEPIIGQRKIDHDLRLREGEVALLGGLINQGDSKTVTGIPGLSSIPILRRLFTGESVSHNREELMIILVPHILRRPEISPADIRTIAVGSAISEVISAESALAAEAAPTTIPRAVGTIAVALVLDGASDVTEAPIQLSFDPKMLRIDDVMMGDLVGADGQQPVFSKSIENDAGQATIQLHRPQGASGITAPSGALVFLSFQ